MWDKLQQKFNFEINSEISLLTVSNEIWIFILNAVNSSCIFTERFYLFYLQKLKETQYFRNHFMLYFDFCIEFFGDFVITNVHACFLCIAVNELSDNDSE